MRKCVPCGWETKDGAWLQAKSSTIWGSRMEEVWWGPPVWRVSHAWPYTGFRKKRFVEVVSSPTEEDSQDLRREMGMHGLGACVPWGGWDQPGHWKESWETEELQGEGPATMGGSPSSGYNSESTSPGKHCPILFPFISNSVPSLWSPTKQLESEEAGEAGREAEVNHTPGPKVRPHMGKVENKWINDSWMQIEMLITMELRLHIFDLKRPKVWHPLRAVVKFMVTGQVSIQGQGKMFGHPLFLSLTF